MGACNSCFSGITASLANASPSGPDTNSTVNIIACKAFFNACKAEDLDTVKKQVADDCTEVDINWPNSEFFNYTGLHMAASRGNDEIVQTLLDARANVDCRSTSDETPLIMAARSRKKSTCRILLDYGADTLAMTNYKGSLAKTAKQYLDEAGIEI